MIGGSTEQKQRWSQKGGAGKAGIIWGHLGDFRNFCSFSEWWYLIHVWKVLSGCWRGCRRQGWMQGDLLEVYHIMHVRNDGVAPHGSSSGRDWKRSCSEYILEMEPPGLTFGMWGITMQGVNDHFLKICLNSWSVSSNLLKLERQEEAQVFWGESWAWAGTQGLRCLMEDVSRRQVDTWVWSSGNTYGLELWA